MKPEQKIEPHPTAMTRHAAALVCAAQSESTTSSAPSAAPAPREQATPCARRRAATTTRKQTPSSQRTRSATQASLPRTKRLRASARRRVLGSGMRTPARLLRRSRPVRRPRRMAVVHSILPRSRAMWCRLCLLFPRISMGRSPCRVVLVCRRGILRMSILRRRRTGLRMGRVRMRLRMAARCRRVGA